MGFWGPAYDENDSALDLRGDFLDSIFEKAQEFASKELNKDEFSGMDISYTIAGDLRMLTQIVTQAIDMWDDARIQSDSGIEFVRLSVVTQRELLLENQAFLDSWHESDEIKKTLEEKIHRLEEWLKVPTFDEILKMERAEFEVKLEIAKKQFPNETDEWHRVWVRRAEWYIRNDGDMTDAPEFPVKFDSSTVIAEYGV